MDYEFRFFRGPAFEALHVTTMASDTEACERARAYLCGGTEFSHVEVRRGFRFMLRIENDSLPGQAPLPPG